MARLNWIRGERAHFVDDLGIGAKASRVSPAEPHNLAAADARTFTPRSGEIDEAAPAPRAVQRPAYVWWVYAFLVGLVLPNETAISIGPLVLSPYRVLLIVFLVPGMIMLFSGRAGRLRAADGFMAAHALWAALALLVNHGIGAGLEPAGIYVIEVIGSYLIGRCCVRTAADFRRIVYVLFWLIAMLLPFAAFEAVTGNAIIRNIFRMVIGAGTIGSGDQRLGLTRPYVSFEHPILYGVFCAASFSLVFYVLAGTSWQRCIRAIVIGAATFFSLSSAPLLAFAIQNLLIGWDFATRRMPRRWLALTVGFIAAYIAIDLASNRTPLKVFISYLTFNTETGYFRTYIWDFGIENVWQNPIFGIGLNDWVRPEWMPPSVDNFWLLTTMRYGIPAFIFLIMALALMLWSLSRLRITSPANADMRKGLPISFVALIFAGATVHFWVASFCFFMFLAGAGCGLRLTRTTG